MGQLNSIKKFLNLIEQAIYRIETIYQTVMASIQFANNKITNNDLYSHTFFLPFILEMTKTTILHPEITLRTDNYHSFITYDWTIQSSSGLYETTTLILLKSTETFTSYESIPLPAHLSLNNSSTRIIYNDPNNYVIINHWLRM